MKEGSTQTRHVESCCDNRHSDYAAVTDSVDLD